MNLPKLEELPTCPECGAIFAHPASCTLAQKAHEENPGEWATYDPQVAAALEPHFRSGESS